MPSVSMRDYIDARINDLETRLLGEVLNTRKQSEGALNAADRAIDKAETAIERRLNLLNEFRAQVADQSQRYAAREVVDTQVGTLQGQLSDLGKLVSNLQGRAFALAGMGAVAGSMVSGIVLLLVSH